MNKMNHTNAIPPVDSPNQQQILASKSTIAVAIGGFLISFAPVFVKLSGVQAMAIGFHRVFIAGTLLLIYALWRRERFWQGYRSLCLSISCGFFFCLDLFFWHLSINSIGPGIATMLGNFQVFILAFIGILFFREPHNWKFWTAIPIALGGLLLMVGFKWHQVGAHYQAGVWAGLITGVWYAFYTLTLREAKRFTRYPTQFGVAANLSIVCLSAAFFMYFGALFRHENLWHYSTMSWLWIIQMSVFCQVIAWFLIARGLPHISVSAVGFLLLLQPSLAFLWDVIIFRGPTAPTEITGALITLLAIYLGSTRRKEPKLTSEKAFEEI